MTHTDDSDGRIHPSTHCRDDETDEEKNKKNAAYYHLLHRQYSTRLQSMAVG